MKDESGVEELQARLCLLEPRSELVARMALRLRDHQLCADKRYLARITFLIKGLDLTVQELTTVRADAQRAAASLDSRTS
jgi:hypothetical protein